MSRSSTTTDLFTEPSSWRNSTGRISEANGAVADGAGARAVGVPPRRINEVVLGRRAIGAGTDLRLGRHFRMSEVFLRLQAAHDLMARRQQIGHKLRAIKPRAA